MNTFIRTVTINGKPLVLRFDKISETEFEVSCVNDRKIDNLHINYVAEWKIMSGGTDEIRRQETRILNFLEAEAC